MRARSGPVIALGAAAVLMVAAVLAAAMAGPWTLQPRHYGSLNLRLNDPKTTPVPVATPSLPVPRSASRPGAGFHVDGRWFLWAFIVLATAALAYLLYQLWQRFRRTGGRIPERKSEGQQIAAPVEELPEIPVLLRGVQAAQQSLADIAVPDDAIVAAWLAIEDGAQRSGVTRHAAQTPTEFTVAVLKQTPADPAAIGDLLALYHQARFSARPTGPDDVAAALRCLTVLADNWAAFAAVAS